MTVVATELAKVPAFVRRDLLVAWSYRMAFFSDWVNLGFQVVLFYFVGLLVDEGKLPEFGGKPTSYMAFVAIGIAVGAFVALALARVAAGIRQEQLAGTLEYLLLTPTAPATIQIGTVAYDLVYIPLRTALFLLVIALAFGLDLEPSGILPATLVLLAFIPFVWGIGVAAAAGMLTYRVGGGVAGVFLTALTIFSGAYYPLDVFPGWAAEAAAWNPMTLAVDGLRESLLGGADWASVGRKVAALAPMSAVALAVGIGLFHLALKRERRRGTLGLY